MSAENFNEACDPSQDNLDNDGDGLFNCDDPDCLVCTVCGGTGVGCAKTCKYVVQLTDEDKYALLQLYVKDVISPERIAINEEVFELRLAENKLEGEEKEAATGHGEEDGASGIEAALEALDRIGHEVAADEEEDGVGGTVERVEVLAGLVEDFGILVAGDHEGDQGDAESDEFHQDE